ncbi:hypothetical protein HK104_009514 [Borealophlyctis nickersoniae]|nr:hypothetical protein HK104_009514 [Borealophlyctis nickersoniae]
MDYKNETSNVVRETFTWMIKKFERARTQDVDEDGVDEDGIDKNGALVYQLSGPWREMYLAKDGSLRIKAEFQWSGDELVNHTPAANDLNLRVFLNSPRLSDIDLRVRDEEGKEIVIPAHKVILAGSPYFLSMIESKERLAESATEKLFIKVEDFPVAAVQSMLECLYTSQLVTHAPATAEQRRTLIHLSDMLQISSLHTLVTGLIVKYDLTKASALNLLAFAHKYSGAPGCNMLLDECLKFVRKELPQLLGTKELSDWIEENSHELVSLLFHVPGGK